MTDRQKQLIEEEKDLQAAILSFRTRQTEAQGEMDEASAREDYEAADELSEEIEQLSVQIAESSKTIGEKHNEYAELEASKSQLYGEQRAFLAEVLGKSKEFSEKEAELLGTLRQSTEEYKRTTSDNLEASSIELEVCQEENTKHQDEVRVRREELDTEIRKETGDLEEAKAGYQEDLTAVNEEIADLEAKLLVLKGRHSTLTEQIHETNKVIQGKLEDFESVIAELSNEEGFLTQESKELDGKKDKLKQEQGAFEEELTAQQQAIDTKAKWLDDYQTVMAEAHAEAARLEKIVGDRKQRLSDLKSAEAALGAKLKSLEEAENYEAEVKRNYELFMQSIVQKEARIREIDTRIPGLEAEKKTLASARLFKVSC
jgi:chromosome segregation ATPase